MKLNARVLLPVLAAFVVGVVAGRLWPVRRAPVAAPTPASRFPTRIVTAPPSSGAAIAPPRVAARATPPLAPLDRLRAFTELNDRLQQKMPVALLSGESLNPDFVTLFGLSDLQAQALRDELASVKKQLAEIEARRAVITPTENGGYRITIQPFTTEGGQVYDQFMQSLHRILGDERYALYARNPAVDVERASAFGRFGLNATTIDVAPVSQRPEGSSQWSTNSGTGLMTTDVSTNPPALAAQYPALYARLVAEGKLPRE